MEYRIELPNKDYDLILTEYKEIPLTQGKVALVDAEDYDWLNQWKWYASKQKNGSFYAMRRIKENGKRFPVLMHRIIIKTPKNMETDHINRNGLDNRKYNLRICTNSQNQMNRGKPKNNKSGYKGVYWNKKDKRWRAEIMVNQHLNFLGNFSMKEDAALAYNKAAIKHYGEFAYQNKP